MKQMKIIPQTLKGFRDFLPAEMVVRQKAIEILKKVFASFGFEPLETPALEYAETLLGKYGREANKLLYLFNDKGGRKIGLRYDLTVPLARVMASNQNIPLPFKRYQLQPVWRAEKPQKGRFREFWQCDIDIIGTASPLADAEIIAIIYRSLKALGLKEFTIKINSRQVLFELMEKAGIVKEKRLSVIRSLDKIDKIGREKVEKELEHHGLNNQTINGLFDLINQAAPDDNLNEVFKMISFLKVPKAFWQFEPILARGLDYYTGPIFETTVKKPKKTPGNWQIGSITGGGRWDKLINQFSGRNLPATGTSFGLERIVEIIREFKLWPDLLPTNTKVLVTIFSPEYLKKSTETVLSLRRHKINAELYLNSQSKLDQQLKYANRKGIPYVLIIGPKEIKEKQITIKDMKKKTQKTITLEDFHKSFLCNPWQ